MQQRSSSTKRFVLVAVVAAIVGAVIGMFVAKRGRQRP